jgi:hypothetical protein
MNFTDYHHASSLVLIDSGLSAVEYSELIHTKWKNFRSISISTMKMKTSLLYKKCFYEEYALN